MNPVKDRINIIDARKSDYLKEEFFKQNMRLVYDIAVNKLGSVPLDREEKISIGSFGLVKAFNTYDEKCGYAFSTYATRCITNEILHENRKSVNKNERKSISLDGIVTNDDVGNELLVADLISDKEEDFDKYDFEDVRNVYKKFVEIYSEKDPKLIIAFDLYVLKEMKTTEMTKHLGVKTQSASSRAGARAIKAIQEIAMEMGVIDNFNRYSRHQMGKKEKAESKVSNTKRRALYALLNYPQLTSKEIADIINWDSYKVGMLKTSIRKDTFKLPPDDSIKDKIEEYLANK